MKKMLVNLYVKIVQAVLFVVHKTRIYKNWSYLYRFLYHRKFIKIQLPASITPREAQHLMNVLTWRADKAKEAWDSVGSPNWVQHCINEVKAGHAQPDGALDCDDYASWATQVIAPAYRPIYLCQGWQLKSKDEQETAKMSGHAVCVYRSIDTGGYYYCGNWGNIGPFINVKLLVRDMLNKADAGQAVSWASYDKNLNLIRTGNGIPNDIRKERNKSPA